MAIKIYHYPQCGTCRKALKWFKDQQLEVNAQHIVEDPPTKEQLRVYVEQSGLDIRKFFNTSGLVYKELKLKDKLSEMPEEDMLNLLASNGKLIKRPIVTDGNKVTVGFKEEQYESVWGRS
jgi:arsenate reductase